MKKRTKKPYQPVPADATTVYVVAELEGWLECEDITPAEVVVRDGVAYLLTLDEGADDWSLWRLGKTWARTREDAGRLWLDGLERDLFDLATEKADVQKRIDEAEAHRADVRKRLEAE